MELLVQQKGIGEHDLVRAKPNNLPSSANHSNKNRNENGNENGPVVSVDIDGDDDPKKKKTTSKNEKKNRRRTKPHRKLPTDEVAETTAILSTSDHTGLDKTSRRSSRNIKSRRRQSMSCIDNKGTSMSRQHSHDSAPNLTDGNNCDSADDLSIQSQNKPSSDRSLNSIQSRKNRIRASSYNSLNSIQSQKNQIRSSSNLSLNSIQSQKNQIWSSSNHSSSNYSFNSDLENSMLSSHGYDIGDSDGKKQNFPTNDFGSDVEDDCETKCSVDNINLAINNEVEASLTPTALSDKDSTPNGQRSREEKITNRDPDAKQRKKRQPQLSQTDELGRGSNHYKLEGVYINQRTESNVKKAIHNESDDEEEIQVLTKLPADSNGKDTRNRTPTKGRFRSRRRGSIGTEQPRATKDFTRMRNARTLDRLGTRNSHNKSNEKRIKRGCGADVISPETKEAVKKLFGSDPPSSEEDTIVVKNKKSVSEPSSSSSIKDTEEKPLEMIEIAASDDQSLSVKDTKQSSTKAENVSPNKGSPSKDVEKKQRKRNSIGKTPRKDKAPTQCNNDAVKKLIELDIPLSEEDQNVTKSTDQEALTEIENTTSENQLLSLEDTKESLENTEKISKTIEPLKKQNNQSSATETENPTYENQPSSLKDTKERLENTEKMTKKVESSSKDLEKKQRRRNSMGKNPRKDRTHLQSEDLEKELISLVTPLSEEVPIVTKSNEHAALTEIKNAISENQPSSLKDRTESLENTEKMTKKTESSSKDLEKKQRRRNSAGKNPRKDRTQIQSEDLEKEVISPCTPLSEMDPIATKNADQIALTEIENATAENRPSSLKDTEESLEELTEKAAKKIESSAKILEKKQRRRNSVGKNPRKDRTHVQSEDLEKELISLVTPLSEEDPMVTKYIDKEALTENEITTSESRPASTSSMKDIEDVSRIEIEKTASKNQPSSTLNDTEKSLAKTEKASKKIESSIEDLDKKHRRRSSVGKSTRKDRASSTRISNKSGHKSQRKSTREKKSRPKNVSTLEVNPQIDSSKKNDLGSKLNTSSTELNIYSASEEFVSGGGMEINEIHNHEANESAKRRDSTEKTSKKDRDSSRRSSAKERKNREKVPSPIQSNRQNDIRTKNDPDSEVNISSIEPTISSSVIEFHSESEKKINETKDTISLNDSNSECKDADSFFSASLGSDESVDKDNENVNDDDDNYLQLTFVAENGAHADNLFALMDEKFNQSFHMEGLSPEADDRNVTGKSFVSFTDEIDLKVSTTSCSLSRIAPAKGVDDVLSDEEFSDNSGELTKKTKRLSTSASKKKVSPFSLSKSLHDVGRYRDNIFADGIRQESPRKKKRDGMLKKMKTGISQGGKRTLHKAASTRVMLEQATTKAFSRGKEEGRGLLRNDSG